MSSGVDPRKLADSYQPNFGTPWTPDATIEQLQAMPTAQLVAYHAARKKLAGLMEQSPTGAGWALPSWYQVMEQWKNYPIHIILGGRRSSKTSFAARLCIWGLGNIPECEIRAYHVNADRSQQDQQKLIWQAIPNGLKNLPVKKGQYHSVMWNQRTGFTNDTLIFPALDGWRMGGRIDFGNYKQYQQDPQVTEGFRAHIIWGDEQMPLDMFSTLTYRTTDFHGRIVLTFATMEGWSPLVQAILGKRRTLKKRYSELAKRELPIMEESLSWPGACIHYFWTLDNPFIDGTEFKKKLLGKSMADILSVAHGVPTKSATAVFTMFDQMVNVVKHDDLPFVKNPKYETTRYMCIDPGGSKNWAMLWVAVDAMGTWWVYREWPDYDDWALPGPTPDGKRGPAQTTNEFGIRHYVELIKESEKLDKAEIFERLIDPRAGSSEKAGDDGATNLIRDLEAADLTVMPAPGLHITEGLEKIKSMLYWKPHEKRDSINSPKIFVSDRCRNVIYALAEYTNYSTHEACKDWIDMLRYLATADIQYFSAADRNPKVRTGVY